MYLCGKGTNTTEHTWEVGEQLVGVSSCLLPWVESLRIGVQAVRHGSKHLSTEPPYWTYSGHHLQISLIFSLRTHVQMLNYLHLLIFCAYTSLKAMTNAAPTVVGNWLRQELAGRLFSLELVYYFVYVSTLSSPSTYSGDDSFFGHLCPVVSLSPCG